MQKRNRTQLVLGVLLILVAGWLIATRANPGWQKSSNCLPLNGPCG